MFLRSGDNLTAEVEIFIQNAEQIRIFSPFVTTTKLKEILGEKKCLSLVVRWQATDILNNACDFESLYQYCEERNIKLYRNTRIHMKVIENLKGKLFFGSSNISNRGIGDENFNWELSKITDEITLKDRIYLDKVIFKSDYVDQEYFQELKSKIDQLRKEYNTPLKNVKIEIPEEKGKFLLSALPMSFSPEKLWEIYSSDEDDFSQLELSCAASDLANYDIQYGYNKADFFNELSISFNSHKFIKAFKFAIASKRNKYMGFTEVIRWLQNNTTTVPTPRRWDIKNAKTVQVLHRWIVRFDANFKSVIKHPNGSDKLVYIEDHQI